MITSIKSMIMRVKSMINSVNKRLQE